MIRAARWRSRGQDAGVRVGIAIAVMLALTGCGSGAKKSAQGNVTDGPRVERCTQRFLDRIKRSRGPELRSYVETAYCRPFARRGWVYADGTLSINAHVYVMNGYSCGTTTLGGGTTTTTPCKPTLDPLECAILHNVRRNEVTAYIRKLQRTQIVRCDDGTPLDKLGTE
jgi:hypothetical protein